MSNIAILIPAYRPTQLLISLVTVLREKHVGPIVVVDDGSAQPASSIFDEIARIHDVLILKNAINLGKGAALKNGINHILNMYADCRGIVTADADGQHSIDDILTICRTLNEQPDAFVLGCRVFDSNTPFKSRFGNNISRFVYRLLLGLNLKDTQTGLRGLPRDFAAQTLHIRSNRYEFETEQLTLAAKLGVRITEIPIQTIYLDDNAGSHFDPVFDSLRIYFVVFRYALSSIATAAVDLFAFIALSGFMPGVMWTNLASRLVALGFQFALLKHFVFHAKGGWLRFISFIVYVAATGIASGALQLQLDVWTGIRGVAAKIIVETLIFVFNFLFLRHIIFRREPQ